MTLFIEQNHCDNRIKFLWGKKKDNSINLSHLRQLKLQQTVYSIPPLLFLKEKTFFSRFRKLKFSLCLLTQKLLWCVSLFCNVQMSLIKPILWSFPELFLVKAAVVNYFWSYFWDEATWSSINCDLSKLSGTFGTFCQNNGKWSQCRCSHKQSWHLFPRPLCSPREGKHTSGHNHGSLKCLLSSLMPGLTQKTTLEHSYFWRHIKTWNIVASFAILLYI